MPFEFLLSTVVYLSLLFITKMPDIGILRESERGLHDVRLRSGTVTPVLSREHGVR